MAEDYGDESLKENVTDGDMEATGEYVVLAAFTAVGEDRITQILQQDGMEGDSLGFALSKGIVSEDQLDRKLRKKKLEKYCQVFLRLIPVQNIIQIILT